MIHTSRWWLVLAFLLTLVLGFAVLKRPGAGQGDSSGVARDPDETAAIAAARSDRSDAGADAYRVQKPELSSEVSADGAEDLTAADEGRAAGEAAKGDKNGPAERSVDVALNCKSGDVRVEKWTL